MIYQDIKRFLKRYLQKPNKSYEWSGHDNLKLMSFIQGRYSDEQIKSNVSEIRQAYRDFFEPVGNIIVRFKENVGVNYKIISYSVEPKDSKHLSRVIDIIRENRRYVEYPYKGRDDQIGILGKIRRHINAEIIETDERVNKKELVRYAIKEALELEDRDVVLHLKRRFIVKIFKKNILLNKNTPNPKPKDDDKRFRGYNADDLSSHYDELVNDIDLVSFLDDVMATLFATKLNFDEITNNYYESNVLSLIRYAIANELKQYASQNEDYILGLAGYIFRKNFTSIHERIAIEIFEQFSKKSQNAEKFLLYYSGTIHLENGKRYAIPEITTLDGKRWNVTSITAIATMWLRARDGEFKLEAELENLKQEYVSISTEYESVKELSKNHTDRLNILVEQFQEVESSIANVRKEFRLKDPNTNDEKMAKALHKIINSDQQKLILIKEKIIKIKPLKEKANRYLKSMHIRYNELKARKQFLELEIRTSKQNLDLNSESFHSILSSLVKALMQRKQLIEE